MNCGPYTLSKIAHDKTLINKIQSSPNYFKIIKYPDNLTAECMLWILVTEVDTIPLVPMEETIEINNPFGFFYNQPKMPYDDDYQDKPLLHNEHPHDEPPWQDEMTGIQFEPLKECVELSQKNKKVKFVNNPMFQPHDFSASNTWKVFNTITTPYDFKVTQGISSLQTIIKDIKHVDLIKLSGGSWEQKVHRFKGNYDAISNIKMSINNIGLFGEQIECILKVNNTIIYSKAIILPNSTVECKFINFPNFIVNYPNSNCRIEIFIRMNYVIIDGDSLDFIINYDTIMFDGKSRTKIINECTEYIFETASGIICRASKDYCAPKYMTQLIDTVDNNFKHLYKYESNSNKDIKLQEIIKEPELNGNITIIL